MNYGFIRIRGYWLSGLCTLAVTGLFWIAYGCEWDRMYSPSPFHRLQAAAMLDGHFELSHSIENIEWDLAWHDGRLNHVWGLGIGMWILPFETAFRCCGGRDLPDRIPLLVAVALLAWYTSRTAMVIAHLSRSRISGILFVYLTLAFPPLWNLAWGRKLVYEDTVLYATILALTLLMGTIRSFLLRSPTDFYIVCVLGALSSLVRPTFGIYGAIAPCLSGLAMLRFRGTHFTRNPRIVVQIGAGWILVLAGFLLLVYSNQKRFGSPWEFGHRLNVSGDMIIYATRFGNPFAGVGSIDAAKELFSWIFLSPFHQTGDWCAPNILPWQANTIRWRDIYQPTFDPTWLLVLGYGLVAGVGFLWHRGTKGTKARWKSLMGDKPFQRLITALLLWFAVASVALSAFYLRFPTISTRYILDFSPAFLSIFLAVMLLKVRRFPKTVVTAACLWLICEHMMLLFHPGVEKSDPLKPFSFSEVQRLPVANGKKISEFKGKYTVEQHPNQTGIRYNGFGWFTNGLSKSVISLMVDRPQLLEICLAEHQEGTERPAASGVYRARIDNEELPIQYLTHEFFGTNSAIRIRFGIPAKVLRQNGDQVVFLCLTKSLEEADLRSIRRLYEIRWR